jgi:beta-glucosidase
MKILLHAGADLRGYFHCSLTDNFEWNEGWHLRFGLFELGTKTQERRPRASAGIYAEIIRKGRNGSER